MFNRHDDATLKEEEEEEEREEREERGAHPIPIPTYVRPRRRRTMPGPTHPGAALGPAPRTRDVAAAPVLKFSRCRRRRRGVRIMHKGTSRYLER